jgi:glycyl-tRNA synthetase beta chain
MRAEPKPGAKAGAKGTPNIKDQAKIGFGEFLLEVGCEEIPAGMIPGAAKELKVILNKYLQMEKLADGAEIVAFGAPRRLVATCPRVRLKQEDIQKEIIGPPKSKAFDAQNAPTQVAQGFAAKYGVGVEKLFTVSTPRGE